MIQNPTIQATFPLGSTLTLLRTSNSSFTPLPNTTAFGPSGSGSIYAQLFYAGVEQFFCSASSCAQSVSTNGSADWTCSSVSCTCRKGTTYCGNGPLDLSGTIDGLSGALEVQCDAIDPGSGTATCAFKQSIINGIFGNSGLGLAGCTFGECVSQGVIDVLSSDSSSSASSGSKGSGSSLSGGVIAGLAVVGSLIALALFFLVLGCVSQRRMRRSGSGLGAGKSVKVSWSNVGYAVQGAGSDNLFGGLRKGKRDANDDKVILDGVGGKVDAGQMMAILGPSGKSYPSRLNIWRFAHSAMQVPVRRRLSRFLQESTNPDIPQAASPSPRRLLPRLLEKFASASSRNKISSLPCSQSVKPSSSRPICASQNVSPHPKKLSESNKS
jgi:hypothetical protein